MNDMNIQESSKKKKSLDTVHWCKNVTSLEWLLNESVNESLFRFSKDSMNH